MKIIIYHDIVDWVVKEEEISKQDHLSYPNLNTYVEKK